MGRLEEMRMNPRAYARRVKMETRLHLERERQEARCRGKVHRRHYMDPGGVTTARQGLCGYGESTGYVQVTDVPAEVTCPDCLQPRRG